jgi:hypothetical protein
MLSLPQIASVLHQAALQVKLLAAASASGSGRRPVAEV